MSRMPPGVSVPTGPISRDQFTSMMTQMRSSYSSMGGGSGRGGPPGIGGPGGDMDSMYESRFKRYDVNGDGLLNHDEMPESLKAEREKWDTDRNGLIDLNEYKAYATAMMQQRMQENGGSPWGGGGWGGWSGPDGGSDTPAEEEDKKPVVIAWPVARALRPPWFQHDTDSDSQISLYEWKKIPARPSTSSSVWPQ